MNPNPPENLNNDIDPADKLQEIQTFLTGQEFQVYTGEDKEYEYLDKGYYCITLRNTKGNTLYIDLTDEFTLTYKGVWHCHYDPDIRGYSEMLHDLRGLLDNKLPVLNIYSKDRWECSALSDFELATVADIDKQISTLPKEIVRRIKQDGAEIRLQFWDEDKNKIIRSEPDEK